MLHACVHRFDATGGRGNILGSKRSLSLTTPDFDRVWLVNEKRRMEQTNLRKRK
jgi:hypothetical protein